MNVTANEATFDSMSSIEQKGDTQCSTETSLSPENFYNEHQQEIYAKTNTLMYWVLIFQWPTMLLVAGLHVENWTINFDGNVERLLILAIVQSTIISLPIYLIKHHPEEVVTRIVVSLAQVLTAGLLVNISSASLLAHFYLLGSLVLLASYRYWPSLLAASAVVVADQCLLSAVWPSMFLGFTPNYTFHWLEYAFAVLLINAILIRAILVSRDEMQKIAVQNARLISTNAYVQQQVEIKSRELDIQNFRLLQAQKMESIGQMAAGIAHEINTPIQYVGDNASFLWDTFTDLNRVLVQYDDLVEKANAEGKYGTEIQAINDLKREIDIDYLTTEIPSAIEQSIDGVNRISKIVKAMKEFSHPSENEKKQTDINHSIESTVTVARNEWKYVSTVDIDLDENLPTVKCLTDEFNQVLLNLVINAAHAISDVVAGTEQLGKIRISTSYDDRHVTISISDTGNGIPESIRHNIYDPFFTTKEVGRGTGQGLAIAHSVVVDKHQGEISFETKIGQGTTFYIKLPR